MYVDDTNVHNTYDIFYNSDNIDTLTIHTPLIYNFHSSLLVLHKTD